VFYGIKWALTPRPRSLMHANLRLRLALCDVERSLLQVHNANDVDRIFDVHNTELSPISNNNTNDNNNYNNNASYLEASQLYRDDHESVANAVSSARAHHQQVAKGLLHYNLFRLRQELFSFFRITSPNGSDLAESRSRTMTVHRPWDALRLWRIPHLALEYFIFGQPDPLATTELSNILQDVDDLSSADSLVDGRNKILTVVRMRSCYRCFSPKI
jgi:hypothetical protein